MNNDDVFIEIFGQENLQNYTKQCKLLNIKENDINDLYNLKKKSLEVFKINLSFPEITTAVSAGVLLGLANSLFKNYIHIKKMYSDGEIKWDNGFGKKDHEHGVKRTIIDSKPPLSKGLKNRTDLHRQIGPTHDIMRFKDALDLIMGKTTDYKLWGRTATKILGHDLGAIGINFQKFIQAGGFNIINDPAVAAKELMNHLLIDFFAKRSLPIPGSTYIADYSPEFAKIMLNLYDEGLNLKNTAGNFIGYIIVNLIINSYTFLFKATKLSCFSISKLSMNSIKELNTAYKQLKNENEYNFMMIISQGASFVVDSAMTVGTKSYSGLFQLNYFSLLAVGKNLLQYFLRNYKKYNEVLYEMKNKKMLIEDLDNSWRENFIENFNKNLYDPNFMSLFNANQWKKNDNKVLRLNESTMQLKNLYKQLGEAYEK